MRESKVKFPYMIQLDQIPEWFSRCKSAYKDKDTFLYGWFNDTYLDSDMTLDDVYVAVYGLPKEKYIAKVKRDQEKAEKRIEKEKKEFEDMISEWKASIITKYGSEEKYNLAMYKDRCKKGHRLVPKELWKDWDEMVKNNSQSGYKFVDEVIFYLGYFKRKKPRRFFTFLRKYFNDCDHSNITGTWVIKNIEHFGGSIGRELSEIIRYGI